MSESALASPDDGRNHDVASSDRPAPGSVKHLAVSRAIVRMIRMVGWGSLTLALLSLAGAIARVADLASHFRVAYAFAMLPALATYLPGFARRTWQPALLILALALDCAPIARLYLPADRITDGEPKGPSIRLLQFNTWLKNPRDQDVLALVAARRPDVASLQETTASLRSALTDRLADDYRILSAGDELLLIRSHEPAIRVIGWTRHTIPMGVAIEARLALRGQEVSVLSLHAMAPLGLTRAAIRDAQFEWVARWCRARTGSVIILGDLNASPWSHSFGRLLREGGLVDSEPGFGVQPTWRARFGPVGGMLAWPVQVPIDHCLYSPGLVAVAREVGPACGSNHFPLFVTLRSTEAAVRPPE